MTTNEEINEEPTIRPIEELLRLNSYSLMNDAEIDSVMQYKQQIAYNEGLYQQQITDQQRLIEAQCDMYKSQAEHANYMLDQLIQGGVNLEYVQE